MATLKIERISEFANRVRKIKIYADEKHLGDISNGETKEFEIASGVHVFYAKIDWCTSNKIELIVEETQVQSLRLASFADGAFPDGFKTLYTTIFDSSNFLKLSKV